MWPRRLRSLLALAPAERGLALRAVAWLGVFRVAIHLVSFPRLRRWVEARPHGGTSAEPAHAAPLAVRRALSRAERSVPGATCLAQALTAELLLRELGAPAVLRLGVSTEPVAGRALDAHAWVESDGMVVVGDADFERYSPLASFSTHA